MHIINNIIEQYGEDKMMHFLGGGWIVSMFSPFGWIGIIIGIIIMLGISYIKEKYLDDIFDVKDIIAASIGGGISTLIYLICHLFQHFVV